MKRLVCLVAVVGCLAIAVIEAAAESATNVAAGGSHACALTAGGGVVCWGSNYYGQIGDGTKVDRWTPTAVSGLGSGVTAIAAGTSHTCALTAGGGVVCWGDNYAGQLGIGLLGGSLILPVAVSGLGSGVTAIAAASAHTCALTTAGAVSCWGRNDYGQLGDGTTTQRLTPVAVSGLGSGVTAIAVGAEHTCALTTGGSVVCWGFNINGALGDGTTTNRWTPTPVSGMGGGVAAVAAGAYHACALTMAGGVLCWGANYAGAVGDGTTTRRLTPTPVSDLESSVVDVAAGYGHTCAITTGGSALCWGDNQFGQLGDATTTQRLTPTAVSGLASGAMTVEPGAYGYFTCALTSGGAVFCWGDNWFGQLGDGTTTSRSIPTQVVGLEGLLPQWGDFTGNRKSDVLWRHTSGGDAWLWPMNGASRVSEMYVRTVGDADWEIRGLGDQTGDGRADILWRNKTTGMVYFWPMTGSTALDEVYVATVDLAFDIVGTGDYTGDGRSDILWRHAASGELWLWAMNGAATLSVTYVDTVDLTYGVKGSGDLNADGRADLVWQGATGDVWVWLMNGPEPIQVAYVTTVGDLGYRIVGVADYTEGGRADLLWHHATRGEIWLWEMNGAAKVSEAYVGTVPDINYRIVGTGDYDGDGQADILWHHATAGDVWVWLMDGAVKQSEHYVGTVPDTGYQIVKGK